MSLAAEAVIIRKEERRHKGSVRFSLHNHRVVEVRREARASLLAYAFLRGKPLELIERAPRDTSVHAAALRRAERIAWKFSGRQDDITFKSEFNAWVAKRPKQVAFNPLSAGSNPAPRTNPRVA